MGIFSFRRGSPPAAAKAPEEELTLLRARLAETELLPLKRIPEADLSGDARGVAGLLNRRLDALAAAEKEQQQFIADVSHELRTPLTVLRGSLEVVLEEDRPAEEYREAIGNALLEVRHLTRVSQNLLFLIRGQSGGITLSFANIDLVKFVSDVTRELQPAAGDHGLELAAELPEQPVTAFVDAGRMQQVLHNLLENAIHYTPSGGSVCVRLTAAAAQVRIAVQDTGIGIPQADLPYVFERFFRSDRARHAYRGGTGLGLSIARWIVEAHKGTTSVESQIGKGSTFTVTLPLVT